MVSAPSTPSPRQLVSWSTDDDTHVAVISPEYAHRPASFDPDPRPVDWLIGWRVLCRCQSPSSAPSPNGPTWTSDLVIRTPAPHQHSPEDRRIYAPDGQVDDVPRRYQALFFDLWRREHADGLSALEAIARAQNKVNAGREELERAVRAARAAGQSWEAIGRAAGMTRQGARDRWAQR